MRAHTHTPLLLLVCHPVSSMASSFPPFLAARLHIYFQLPSPSPAFTLPLTGRAAVDDTYPAESSHAGSMDCGTLRGDTHNHTTQPPVCFLFLCLCVLIYLAHLTDPTAAPILWLSQYEKLCMYFLYVICVSKRRWSYLLQNNLHAKCVQLYY